MSITVQIRNVMTGDLSPEPVSEAHANELGLSEGDEIWPIKAFQIAGLRFRDGSKALRDQSHQAN